MKAVDRYFSIPSAILVGSLFISFSILLSSGVITIKGLKTNKGLEQAQVTPADPQAGQPQLSPVTLDQVKEVFGKSLIKFGDPNRKVIALEVADPSCPYCHVAAGKNPELSKQMGPRFTLAVDGGSYIAPVPEIQKLVANGKAAFAWIYTPGHGAGEMGTKAMYCAFEKGKFWEVHDLLMGAKGYDLLNETVKNDKAKSGELSEFLRPAFDPAAMKQCLNSGKYDDRLNEDTALARSVNISGTPGFYINTAPFTGAYSYTEMEAAVNSALQ